MQKVLFLFGQLTDEDVDWLGRIGGTARVGPGVVLIEEGHPIEAIYILLSGRVSVSIAGAHVATRDEGEVFGEMSFVEAMPPSATVRTESPSVVLALDRAEVARRIAADPSFGCRFYRALAMFLSDRLRATTDVSTGRGEARLDGAHTALDGELDSNVLDTLSEAGARFDRLSKMLLAGDMR